MFYSRFKLYVLLSIFCAPIFASQVSWPEFVAGVRQEALAQGIRPSVFDEAFKGIHAPNRRVLRYDRNQPEKRLTYLKYRNTRAGKYRIHLGRKEIKKHEQLLQHIAQQYGVNACFITSLWGLETSYGRFMGSFPVIKSLATLAYDNRRASFFRKQLFYALHILNDGHVDLKNFKGEWAGASGHPQFLPSSWHNYAVDYNGDGRKDIWNTYSDVFASIANYLKEHGWQRGGPWAVQASLPAHFDKSLLTRKVSKTVEQWQSLGVRIKTDGQHITPQSVASVIYPYGGPAMMIFNNFKVIMRWNRSTYYAGTVGYMAEQICRHPL